MTYNQAPSSNSNNGLYFIVGGLLVLALIIGAFVLNTNRAENSVEPAAGYETSAPATNNAPAGNADTTTTTATPSSDTDSAAPLAP